MEDRFIMKVEKYHYHGAISFFNKAAQSFKLAKSWDQVGATLVKVANCYVKVNQKDLAAHVYLSAAGYYEKTNIKEAISCREKAIDVFRELGKLDMCALCYKEIAEFYEQEQDLVQAFVNYKKAADFYQSNDNKILALGCIKKIAQCAALLGKYEEASEIYEYMALTLPNDCYWKLGVKSLFFDAGICQLCKDKDDVVFNEVLKKYQKIDPTFPGAFQYKLLVRLATAIDEKDKVKLSDAVEEYKSFEGEDTWQTTLLSRMAEAIKDDNFT